MAGVLINLLGTPIMDFIARFEGKSLEFDSLEAFKKVIVIGKLAIAIFTITSQCLYDLSPAQH